LQAKSTDLKLALQRNDALERELKEGEAQRNALQAEKQNLSIKLEGAEADLAAAAARNTALENQLEKLQSDLEVLGENDSQLRERIRRLEAMLSEERRKAGQNLLARIVELEAMLESERNKAESLPEIPEVSDIKFRVRAGKAVVRSDLPNLMFVNSQSPSNVFESRPDRVDELQEVVGIGPKLESELNELGIYQFEQLVALSDSDINWLEERMPGTRVRIDRDDWIGQAKKLVDQRSQGDQSAA